MGRQVATLSYTEVLNTGIFARQYLLVSVFALNNIVNRYCFINGKALVVIAQVHKVVSKYALGQIAPCIEH